MTKAKKQTNFEMLRILSMIFIITLHILSHTEVLNNCKNLTTKYYILWIINSIALTGVNIYVLISGYFLIESKFKISKVIKIWSEVLFYSVSIYIALNLFGIIEFNIKEAIRAFMPILSKQYWFATVYILMYILSPYMNKLINNMSKKENKIFMILIVILCCIINVVANPLTGGQVKILGGNIITFLMLYIIAANIRKYDYKINTKKGILLFIITIACICLSKFIPTYLYENVIQNGLLEKIAILMYNYSSIGYVVASVLIFLIFKNINIKNKNINKFILMFSGLTFGVYLIHDNNFIRAILWKNIFGELKFRNLATTLLIVLIAVPIIFIVSASIEYLRVKLFEKLNFKRVIENLSNKIEKIIEKI